jgi:hypothetical protein
LSISDEQIYLLEDLLSVNRDVRRVNSIDFWCALALASVGSSDDKISFCFHLMDGNNDNYLSYNELFVLMVCACRGVAKLKGLQPVPADRIDKLATAAFKSAEKTLQESEISCEDFQSFLLTDDLCRSYLAALGAKLPPVDAAAIVLKRANILRELAEMKNRTDEILCEMDEIEDKSSSQFERGGESALLALQNQNMDELARTRYLAPTIDTEKTTVVHPMNSSNPVVVKKDSSELFYHEVKGVVNLQHSANKYFNTDDLWINQVYDLRKNKISSLQPKKMAVLAKAVSQRDLLLLSRQASQSKLQLFTSNSAKNLLAPLTHQLSLGSLTESEVTDADMNNNLPPLLQRLPTTCHYECEMPKINIYTTAFENLLWKEWEKLPQEIDKLAYLDEITVMALFDRLQIIITYSDAKQCLEEIPKSQLGKYNYQDILSWFRFHYNSFPIQSLNFYYPVWKKFVSNFDSSFEFMSKKCNQLVKSLTKQKQVITGDHKHESSPFNGFNIILYFCFFRS